jgi:tetratricopeptide (TPR) repeat protein
MQCSKPAEKPFVWASPREEAEYWFDQQKDEYPGSRQSQYYLAKSLEADPTFARALLQTALPHLQKGEFAIGFKYLNKAVELEPLEYLGYRGCAKLYYLHDSDGALKDLVELDSMTPNFTDAPWGRDIYYTMGIAEKRRGNLGEALRLFDHSIANTTKQKGEDWVDVKVFLYRGIVKLELENFSGAIADFEKGIFYFDKFMEAYYYKGKALLELGDVKAACFNFKKAKSCFEAGYSYANQLYSMVEEVLYDDIKAALELCE